MTPNKVIESVDNRRPNSYSEEVKLGWISNLDGTVIMSAYGTECGHQIQIYTKSGKTMFFCHLMNRAVNVGDKVKQGDKLGIMGATGTKCFGAHLHFGVYRGRGRNENNLINAEKFLNI